MCINDETGLTKDLIFSGGTVLLVWIAWCLYSICRDSATISYDMSWQQQSSENKYNSVSGNAFCILDG